MTEMDVQNIQTKIARAIRKPVKTPDELQRFLAKWWCRYYKKPYKCAELNNYTLEELLYEYFDIYYHNNPEELDKFLHGESEEGKADEGWLKKMMEKEGGQYLTQDQQEDVLKDMKDEIEAAGKNSSDDLHVDFDETM